MRARHMMVAGNWKMNAATGEEFGVIVGADETRADVDVVLCPPATLVASLAQTPRGAVAIGAQDCHAEASGAHTGDVSAEMLAAAGASHVIIGHSERRAGHGETDAGIRAKTQAAWRAGLVALLCVGESRAERESGQALAVIGRQLSESAPDGATTDRLVVAYEPVWAIGTGLTPTLSEIAEAHAAMRRLLRERFGDDGAAMRLLYGGSVKAANAAEIFTVADVDGALVGGASLRAADFLPIVAAAVAAR